MRKFLHGQRRITLSFVLLTLVFFAVVAVMGWQVNKTRDLNKQNTQRISDIQAARLESCERAYEGVREVFKPFLPKPGKGTPEQRRNARKFNRTVDRLKGQCDKQTGVKETR